MTDRNRITPTPVRLPDELKQYLKHAAVDNRRSLSNEVIHRLEQTRKKEQEAQR